MDYNRVQSYIKSHVLPKLDSLPQDVQSVKNAFDAWKADWTQVRAVKLDNLDATISSRASSQAVDGVRGGVDTTLSRLTTLEGSVAKLEQGLASVHGKLTTPDIKVKYLNKGQGNVLSIKGKGKLYAAYAVDSNVNIHLDGKLVVRMHRQSCGVLYICSNYLHSEDSGRYLTTFGAAYTNRNYNGIYFMSDVDNLVELSSDLIGVSIEPLAFNKSLEVQLESSANYSFFAYSLDPT